MRKLVVLCGAAALGACSNIPEPTAEMAAARSMVSQAQPEAAQLAPQELRAAQVKLEQAERALAEERHVDAKLLAEQAEVDARLALAMARSERQQQQAAQVNQSIESLKQDIERRRP